MPSGTAAGIEEAPTLEKIDQLGDFSVSPLICSADLIGAIADPLDANLVDALVEVRATGPSQC